MKHIKLFESYNEYFYLVIDNYKKLFKPEFLNDGVLKNLRGISTNKDIYDSLGTGVECFIVMDMFDTEKINNISMIDYYDADDLVFNNFEKIKRIMFLENADDKYVFKSLFMKNINSNLLYDIRNNLIDGLSKLSKLTTINTVKDICELCNIKDESLISNYIVFIVSDYRHEEEYIVKDKIFTIPEKSYIYILEDMIDDTEDLEEDYQNLI